MVALFVQTLLLMAAAYFVGAALACLIRRSLFTPALEPLPAARTVEPLPEVMQHAPGGFARTPAPEPKPVPKPAAPAPKPAPGPAAAAVAAAKAERAPAQDLKRIRLIDAGIEAALNKLGVDRYEHIAAWMQPDLKRIGEALGLGGRISQENWIEQAQVLAKGGETYFAMRRARGEAASATPTPDEGERRPIPGLTVSPRPSTGGAAGVVADVAFVAVAASAPQPLPALAAPYVAPDVSGRAAFATRPAAAAAPAAAVLPRTVPTASLPPEPVAPIRPAAPTTRDNLQRISSIGTEVESALVAQGVTRYSQIAHWSPADVERFEKQLGIDGRIGRENWIEQAQILSRGGDTKFSRQYDQGYDQGAPAQAAPVSPPAAAPRPVKLADAIQENSAKGAGEAPDAGRATARSDIGSLRSVRAEVYKSAEPADQPQRAASDSKVLRSAPREDLKRIRGIGVLIENRLNAMGVVAYEQIANWTAADIDRVSQTLDFKGRIERENWVEQARILASGGATEFSRRVDRGEMDTGRYKR
jgi:predicted flap endonuclease-1-like 5' DNA nuclease